MSQSQPDPIRLPPRMQAALERYRNRVWAIKLAEGGLAAVFGLVVSYLTVFSLDRWSDTPAALRGVILAAGSVGMVILFPLKCHNWVWRHRRLEQVARLLRYKFPRFGDHLLGIVELAHGGSPQGTSRTLVEAAMRQVDAELEARDLSDAVPKPRHRRWAWAAGASLALIAMLMAIVPAAGMNALVRWAMPWRVIDRYTFAQLEGGARRRVVPYAEPFRIQVGLQEESPWKPGVATARYEDQTPIVSMRDGTIFHFQIPPQTREGLLSLRVGDARLAVAVEPKTRPALTELRAQVGLPAYLGRSEPLVEDVRGGTVSLVKGSTVVFQAVATRDLAMASMNDRPQLVDGTRVTTVSEAVEESAEYRLTWRDRFGLDAREPQVLRVEALDDRAPTVGFKELKNNRVILTSEVIAFEIQAGDDFGVKRVGLEWAGIPDPVYNPEPSSGEKTVAAGAPAQDAMTVAATFSAAREKVQPQSLRLRAFAEDYLPGRERAYSAPLVVQVFSPAQHFKWLTARMSQWAGAAQEVYEKELQLHRVNEELLNLPPDVLDDPARRKQIQVQAAAEKANAVKLETLVDLGTELVREATRNEEFGAGQLESWAELLEQLKEIAGDRMPSVAQRLAQAAEAPGQPVHPPTAPVPPSAAGERHMVDGPDGASTDPGAEVAAVMRDHSNPPEGESRANPANSTPLVLDLESGYNRAEKAEEAPQIKGGLLIPTTILVGSHREANEGEAAGERALTAAELVLQAVTEQRNLLDAFAGLAGEMNALLLGFENSTFVKRLKAASRNQIDMAVALNNLDGFGLEIAAPDDLPRRRHLGELEAAAAETVFNIQEDLHAYADRRPSKNYERVLDEMRSAAVVGQMRDVSLAIQKNELGRSTIDAEFWADTLDRWAEQLVDPSLPQEPPSEGSTEPPNLTPEIVLEVLRIIHQEIQLREETRELEQAREAMEQGSVRERGGELSRTQRELARKSRELAEQLRAMPKAAEHAEPGKAVLGAQVVKLIHAAAVMDEVEGLLLVPSTGSSTIAAISEVIEILLETVRAPNATMVVKSSSATAPALVLVGLGDDSSRAFIEERAPGQATGKSGRSLPEEFRQGLDVYLNALEGKPIE